jgi:hypothetical protein
MSLSSPASAEALIPTNIPHDTNSDCGAHTSDCPEGWFEVSEVRVAAASFAEASFYHQDILAAISFRLKTPIKIGTVTSKGSTTIPSSSVAITFYKADHELVTCAGKIGPTESYWASSGGIFNFVEKNRLL